MKPLTLPSLALALSPLALSAPVPMRENTFAAVQKAMLQTSMSETNLAGTRVINNNNNDEDESGFDNRPYAPSETESVSHVLSLSHPIQTSFLMSLVDTGDGGMVQDASKAKDISPISATASAVVDRQDEVTEAGMEYPTQKARATMQDNNGGNAAVLLLIFIVAIVLIEKMEKIMKGSPNIFSSTESQIHLRDEKLAKSSILINAS